MSRSHLLLIVDVAGIQEPADVVLRLLLVARILAACLKASGTLKWRYKLVNLSVAATVFQAALQDACKASLTGKAHLPFTSEEHIRCNCTMFEGLRRWLHCICQVTFQQLVEQHLRKKGRPPVQPLVSANVAKELQDVDLHWFNHELNSSVHQNYIAPVVSSAIIIIAQLSENSKDDADHSEHFARAFTPQHARWSNGQQSSTSADKAFPLTLLSRFERAGVKLFWAAPGVNMAADGANSASSILHTGSRTNSRAGFCTSQGFYIDGEYIVASIQQRDVNTALEQLIGTMDAQSEDAAFPGAAMDVCALTAELDRYIAPGETERYQQLMEAARSRKRGKQPGQKQAKAAEKSAPDPELVKTNAAIEARSRALELAKSKQQKAQQQLRRKKLVELHKGKTIVEADVDEEVTSRHRPEPADADIKVDPTLSAWQVVSEAISGEVPAEPGPALALIMEAAKEVVLTATAKLSRCSEVQVAAATVTSPAASLLTPLNTSKVADSPASTTVAPMSVVRQALEAALLQDNDEFWVQNPPDLTNCVPDAGRRNQQAMQVYLRLYILVASKDDTPTETLEDPPIFLPVGALWEGLEEFWSDLVNELPEIPYGGNEHYHNVMKPALTEKIPMTMRMIGRNCGVYFEDDLLIWPEGDRPGTALHSSCGAPAHDSDSHYPHAMASSGQLSLSRSSSDAVQPAVADSAAAHRGGGPCHKQRLHAKLTDILPKAKPRKRELTKAFGFAQLNKKAKPQMARTGIAGPAHKKLQGQQHRQVQTPQQNIRAADLLFSPCDTEDSDAIPETDRKAARSSGGPPQTKASKRVLAFCPIPTAGELEAREDAADNTASDLSEIVSPTKIVAKTEVAAPVAKSTWLQNAANKLTVGRYPGRQMSQQMASLPAGRAVAKHSRLDELLTQLSP